jgi:hypothetical protein
MLSAQPFGCARKGIAVNLVLLGECAQAHVSNTINDDHGDVRAATFRILRTNLTAATLPPCRSTLWVGVWVIRRVERYFQNIKYLQSYLAERAGFEPAVRLSPYARFPGV